MNLPVAELDDRVDERAISRLRQVNSVSGFSTVVSDGTSSSTIEAVKVKVNRDVCCGKREVKAS